MREQTGHPYEQVPEVGDAGGDLEEDCGSVRLVKHIVRNKLRTLHASMF